MFLSDITSGGTIVQGIDGDYNQETVFVGVYTSLVILAFRM